MPTLPRLLRRTAAVTALFALLFGSALAAGVCYPSP